MFKRILVPLDGSRFSSKALPYAVEIARRFDSEVLLLRVLKPTAPMAALGMGAIPGTESPVTLEIAVQESNRQDSQNASAAKQYLSRKTRLINRKGVKASYRVVFGDPAATIQEVCRKEKTRLVVMTTHGKSRLKKALMGSVADKVIRGLKMPVMVVSR
jgi:nucleotide-binding universal stress UspA family protein